MDSRGDIMNQELTEEDYKHDEALAEAVRQFKQSAPTSAPTLRKILEYSFSGAIRVTPGELYCGRLRDYAGGPVRR